MSTEVPNIERDGDLVPDPSAMLPPDIDIPQAGLDRMRSEELANMHPEFTFQGRAAAAKRAAEDRPTEVTPPQEVPSRVVEIREQVLRTTGRSAVRGSKAPEDGLLARHNRLRDIVRGDRPGPGKDVK